MAAQTQTTIVYNGLKKRINDGFYSPAESLHEAALAEEFGVSRNTIKKALLMLESDAYVTMEQNKGARVRSYSKAEVMEFLQFRQELEGFVVQLAVPDFTEADLARLDEIIEKMAERRAEGDLLGYSALNRDFHAVIYSVCPNRMAVDVLQKLKSQMKKYNSKSVLIPGRCDNSFEEHTAILEAIKAKDALRAKELMELHLSHVCGIYDQYYSILF